MKYKNISYNGDDMNVLILAGGKSKKMNLDKPKWSAELLFRENILYLKETLFQMGFNDIYICIRKEDMKYKELLNGFKIILQYDDVVGTAAPLLSYNKLNEDTLIIPCDLPLIEISDLRNFIEYHFFNDNDISILSSSISKNKKYASITRMNNTIYIDEIRRDKLVSLSIYILKPKYLMEFISSIDKVLNFSNLINKANRKYKVYDFEVKYSYTLFNIDTQRDLNIISNMLQRSIIYKHIENKVRILDPKTTYISSDVEISSGTTIYPSTIILNSIIGHNNEIGPFSYIKNSKIGDNNVISSFQEINDRIIGNDSTL